MAVARQHPSLKRGAKAGVACEFDEYQTLSLRRLVGSTRFREIRCARAGAER